MAVSSSAWLFIFSFFFFFFFFFLLPFLATFSAHTASPRPPSRTPAGSRVKSTCFDSPPRTTSAHGRLAWAAPRTHIHRSIRAPPMPSGSFTPPTNSPLPDSLLELLEWPSPNPPARAPRSNRLGPGCSTQRTSLPRRSLGRRVLVHIRHHDRPRRQPPRLPPSFGRSPGQRGGHRPRSRFSTAVTMQVFVHNPFAMIAAPVQCDVDGISKGSHYLRGPDRPRPRVRGKPLRCCARPDQ